MTDTYLAKSIKELDERAGLLAEKHWNVLEDQHACIKFGEEALEKVKDQVLKEDEEVAYVLSRQLVILTESALRITITTNNNLKSDSFTKQWQAIMQNYLQTARDECARLQKRLKPRYDLRITRRREANRLREDIFGGRHLASKNDLSSSINREAISIILQTSSHNKSDVFFSDAKRAVQSDASTFQGLVDPNFAALALSDVVSDKKIDSYLGSSIVELEQLLDGWTPQIAKNISECIDIGDDVLHTVRSKVAIGDDELAFVLSMHLVVYMQKCRDASKHSNNDLVDTTGIMVYTSYIERAERNCESLRKDLHSRYMRKKALEQQAPYVTASAAQSTNVSEQIGQSLRHSKPNMTGGLLYASSAALLLQPQKDCELSSHVYEALQPHENSDRRHSLPPIEAHRLNEASVEQALDDSGIDSFASADSDVVHREDRAEMVDSEGGVALMQRREIRLPSAACPEQRRVRESAALIVAHDFAGDKSLHALTNAIAISAGGPTNAVPVTAAILTPVAEGQRRDYSAATTSATVTRTDSDRASSTAIDRGPSSLPGATGIENLGNDCYMSSILQILNCLPGFQESINEMVRPGSHGLASEIATILRRLKGGSVGDLRELKSVLGTMDKGDRWASNSQQDAHEFCLHLFQMLEENPEGALAGEAGSLPNRPTGERWLFATQSLEFEVQDKLSCGKCKETSSSKPQTMRFLSIDVLDATHGRQTLQDCIKRYLQVESVFYHCGDGSTKKTELLSLPPILIFHIKRFAQIPDESEHAPRRFEKLMTAVEFPIDLDLRELAPQGSQSAQCGLYRLIGIVNHHGDRLESGHYTAHCMNLEDRLWNLFDDSNVTPFPVEKASATASYMLCYAAVALLRRSLRGAT